MQLTWSPAFQRNLKRLIRQNPNLKKQITKTLEQLSEDPFSSGLRTHKLKGELADRYACSINYSDRIVFKFVKTSESEEEILLLAIGSHDEVY